MPHPSCPASLSVGFVASGGRGGKEVLIFFLFFSPIFARGIDGPYGRGGPHQKETSRVILVVCRAPAEAVTFPTLPNFRVFPYFPTDP